MINKVTNYTYQIVSEGIRLAYTYAEINDNGDIVSSNNKKNFIVTDEDVIKKLNDIKEYLENR